MVRGGLLPALTIERSQGQKQTITESQVIMELLDEWHPPSEGYKRMLPAVEDGKNGARYQSLARLERDLFSWWCTLLFRPEGGPSMPGGGGRGGGLMGMLTGGNKNSMSGAMKGFLECLDRVESELQSTSGPWFFDFESHPTMIDFIYVSHVERMLASVAYWKGLNLRSIATDASTDTGIKRFPALNAWLEAFEQRECYLAYKSDYYTHVKDIPPQYGPGYVGGFNGEYDEYTCTCSSSVAITVSCLSVCVWCVSSFSTY
jgi:glutathione S-transferase